MDNFKSKKMFILISTLMTWAMTRPQDPVILGETLINLSCNGISDKIWYCVMCCAQDDIDLIFREEDFRRRRPHPRFKYHNELEKLVLKLSKIVSALPVYQGQCTLVGRKSFRTHWFCGLAVLRIAKGINFRFSVRPPIWQKKAKLLGYVVACGLQYGLGENLFHFFFKVSVRVIERNWLQMYRRGWPTFSLMWN